MLRVAAKYLDPDKRVTVTYTSGEDDPSAYANPTPMPFTELFTSLETRTVDNFIRKLRLALEEDASAPRHIISVRGAGYRFLP